MRWTLGEYNGALGPSHVDTQRPEEEGSHAKVAHGQLITTLDAPRRLTWSHVRTSRVFEPERRNRSRRSECGFRSSAIQLFRSVSRRFPRGENVQENQRVAPSSCGPRGAGLGAFCLRFGRFSPNLWTAAPKVRIHNSLICREFCKRASAYFSLAQWSGRMENANATVDFPRESQLSASPERAGFSSHADS